MDDETRPPAEDTPLPDPQTPPPASDEAPADPETAGLPARGDGPDEEPGEDTTDEDLESTEPTENPYTGQPPILDVP